MSSNNPLPNPVYATTSKMIDSFYVSVINVVLNTSATLEIKLFNGNNLVDIKFTTISGQDYLDWGSNDQYIVNYAQNWIMNNIN